LDVEGPNEKDELWRRVIVGKGIQGVQTDHPEALIAWLKENQLRGGGMAGR
jgi:hypothetical protein